jgi:hypothetical protein
MALSAWLNHTGAEPLGVSGPAAAAGAAALAVYCPTPPSLAAKLGICFGSCGNRSRLHGRIRAPQTNSAWRCRGLAERRLVLFLPWQ